MAIDLTKVKPIYQSNIDLLINQLGKTCRLFFPQKLTNDPEASKDHIHGGSLKPKFKINQPTRSNNTEDVTALIQWNPRNLKDFEINVKKGNNVVRLKTFLRDVPSLTKAEYIIPDVNARGVVEKRFKLLQDPVPQGLIESRYAISFWEEI